MRTGKLRASSLPRCFGIRRGEKRSPVRPCARKRARSLFSLVDVIYILEEAKTVGLDGRLHVEDNHSHFDVC